MYQHIYADLPPTLILTIKYVESIGIMYDEGGRGAFLRARAICCLAAGWEWQGDQPSNTNAGVASKNVLCVTNNNRMWALYGVDFC